MLFYICLKALHVPEKNNVVNLVDIQLMTE